MISCNNWRQILGFAVKLVNEMRSSITRVGVVRYAREATVMWNIGDIQSTEELEQRLLNLDYGTLEGQLNNSNSTNMAAGLRIARTAIFNAARRADAGRVAVLITDGKADYEADRTIPEAKALQNAGVDVFSVGVTQSVNETELMLISSSPKIKNQNWFIAPVIGQISSVLDRLLRIACCDLKSSRSTCRLDICFIIDRSGSICDNDPTARPGDATCNNWKTVLSFMVDVTRTFDIGPNATRIAAVLFGSPNQASTKMIWDFNKYTDRAALEKAILKIEFQYGNTYTAGGLEIAKDEVFTVKGGDRTDVDNIAIIITDGKSTIQPQKTVKMAEELRNAGVGNLGVTIYSIGITKEINETELKLISSPPHDLNVNYFTTPDFEKLSAVLDKITIVACCPPIKAEKKMQKCELDLSLIMDASGSICDSDNTTDTTDGRGRRTCNNWRLLKNFLAQVVDTLPDSIGSSAVATKISLVVFSGTARVAFDFNRFTSKKQIVAEILDQGLIGSSTNTPLAFETTRNRIFSQSAGDRPNVQNVALIVTDGFPCPSGSKCPPPVASFTQRAIQEAERLEKEKGVKIYAVGVTDQIDEETLRRFSSFPEEEGRTYWSTPNFKELSLILEKVVGQACGGKCEEPDTCKNEADIVFVVDTSGSIAEEDFEKAKEFLLSVVRNLDLKKIRIGVLSFATNPKPILHLNQYTSQEDIAKAISEMEHSRGKTNTGEALKFMVDEMFTAVKGDRADVHNLAIVITDGGSNDKNYTITQAIRAKINKIGILSVGVGAWLDKYELRAIATHPHQKNSWYFQNYAELDVEKQVLKFRDYICRNKNTRCANDNPCLNGGTCREWFDGYKCICPKAFGGIHCDYKCKNPADVALAIDASGSIGKNNFQLLVEFSQNLLLSLPLDDGTRVAMETYSDSVRVYFNLDTYDDDQTSKFRVLNSLTIPYFRDGTTRTDLALRVMRESLFKQGNDPKTPNVGIVITDGRSDNTTETWKEAMLTRAAGNQLLVITVGGNVRRREVQGIASWPVETNIFDAPDYHTLSNVMIRVRDAICNVKNDCDPFTCQGHGQCVDTIGGYYCKCLDGHTGKNCERGCDGTADILFIVDTSGSIRQERFDDVKAFINSIVMELEVWDNKVKIGVVTFDDTAQVEFYLDTYTVKQDIMEAIRFLKYRGGRTNIADALKTGREQVFQADRGDRLGVPNFVILFSDGAANINAERTIPEAIATRIAGAQVITVGVGTALDMYSLYAIASRPFEQTIFPTSSFHTLPQLVPSVVKAMCNDVNECESNPCLNDGTCTDGLGQYICICDSEYTGQTCERRCSRLLDLVLVVDLSGSIDHLYNLTEAFCREVIWGLNFEMGRTRAATVTYADTAQVVFDLSAYSKKMDVLNTVVLMRTGGRTNTQEALKVTRDEVLVQAKGDRDNVQNVVVLITDGGSNVEAENTIPMANDLKARGNQFHVVAVGDTVNMAEVNMMASSLSEPDIIRLLEPSDVKEKASLFLDSICQ